MYDSRHDRNIRKALSQQRVRSVREALFRLTAGNKSARLLTVAMEAGESEDFIREAYAEGKLHGFRHTTGVDGGFRRILRLVS